MSKPKTPKPVRWSAVVRPRPLLLTIEVCGPLQLKPGYFKGRFKDGWAKRVWWLWFAFGWVRMDLHDYNRYIASGATEWRERSNK